MAPPSSSQPALLRLPAELSNEIYAGVFTSSHLVATSEPGLLQTCRQIRTEALGLFYSSTALQLTITGDDTHHITRWLDSTPCTLLARIPNLIIEVNDDGAILADVQSNGPHMPPVLLVGEQKKWIALGKAFRDKGISAAKVKTNATEMLDEYNRMASAQASTVVSNARHEILEVFLRLWARGNELVAAMEGGDAFTAADDLRMSV
ncbi:hypothetical protein EJ03DRAFT_165406 [Teratosphaeria nubilosa]|uniref:F-box domain-containing protein n=1 Tax=Teratosphaeria nubilosa TaxID=161662 RepID=A0A6G1L206_9PEZI|nr:hypothetical protein EJ03DRAFT_165406 [Teratosphaeria nubilosa]